MNYLTNVRFRSIGPQTPCATTFSAVFNIMDLARTTDQVLITRTRRNVQNRGFSAPKMGCFYVASLLSESWGWF